MGTKAETGQAFCIFILGFVAQAFSRQIGSKRQCARGLSGCAGAVGTKAGFVAQIAMDSLRDSKVLLGLHE